MAIFSIVATPIGNLEDITLRALNVLRKADYVFCEDTRITKRLLDHYNIRIPMISYHVHNKLSRKEMIAEMLRNGKNLVLVSDAGTPGISDPGIELTAYLREELSKELINNQIKFESIPGPSALSAAISIAGVQASSFVFLGFLPHKKGRETIFREIYATKVTTIFYESPHRIIKTLKSLLKYCPDKKVTICRELTKIYEEVITGKVFEVQNYLENNPEKIKGEFVVFVSDR